MKLQCKNMVNMVSGQSVIWIRNQILECALVCERRSSRRRSSRSKISYSAILAHVQDKKGLYRPVLHDKGTIRGYTRNNQRLHSNRVWNSWLTTLTEDGFTDVLRPGKSAHKKIWSARPLLIVTSFAVCAASKQARTGSNSIIRTLNRLLELLSTRDGSSTASAAMTSRWIQSQVCYGHLMIFLRTSVTSGTFPLLLWRSSESFRKKYVCILRLALPEETRSITVVRPALTQPVAAVSVAGRLSEYKPLMLPCKYNLQSIHCTTYRKLSSRVYEQLLHILKLSSNSPIKSLNSPNIHQTGLRRMTIATMRTYSPQPGWTGHGKILK